MIYGQLREYFSRLIEDRGWREEAIRVRARPLTAEEAIGTPKDGDYPLLKGKERLMEAQFREARGQAYADQFGDFEGSLQEITELELTDNFHRAVFISSLNAVMRSLNLIEGTVHCRDREPEECGRALDEYLLGKFGRPERAVLVGHQPRLLEALAARCRVRAVDLDPENIGRTRSGVVIEPPEDIGELIEWADLLLVTGTTIVNGTIELFLGLKKPVIFYGVTIAGPAHILNLNRFCARGH
ncbi:MAG: DUF364 domain-containing protein [Candidatus Erginobacter occultus]|nr:DUF364 domain-containing protein [Candidatus Erginobacter occultus]